MTSDFDMAEVKGSLQKVEKKIELVEEEMEQVKTALKIKGTYLGSNGRKWQQEQLRQLQEKERLLMEDKRQLQEDKRQLREKELGLLPPQTPAPEPAETPNIGNNGDHQDGSRPGSSGGSSSVPPERSGRKVEHEVETPNMGNNGDHQDGSRPVSSGGSSSVPPKGPGSKAEMVGVDGHGVKVIKPAVVYHTNGTVCDLPSETIKAVEEFVVPKGFQRSGCREHSFMYSLGVYVKPVDPNDRRHKYFCLATSSCRMKKMVIPCKNGDRSNVNTHHKKQHKLRGAQSVIKAEKQQSKTTTIHRSFEGRKKSSVGTSRDRELMAAKMIVEKFLPFTFFSSGTAWAELVGVLTTGNTPFPALPARRVKHLIVEMYVATKKVVVGNMLEEIKKAPLPIFHQALNLWTCEVSGRRYLAFHGSYVDSNFVLRNVLLSVKHYAPSAAVQEVEKASKVLFTVLKATLAEYGIGRSDVAGGTTDSGPDVKATCANILLAKHGIQWDWCTCHLVDKAVENAFGTSADPQKYENKEARDILKLVIKTAARVNQSTTFKQRFEELELEMLEGIFKITKHAPRRWLNLVRTLERIIRLWHVLRKLHVDDGEEFPLDRGSNKDAILQLYSLLQPLSAITRDGQYGGVPMTAEIHLAFAVLKIEVLDLTKPLKVFDIPPAPGSPEEEQGRQGRGRGKPPLPSKMVLPNELHPIAVKTRKELSRAFLQRLYARVWDRTSADPSPYRDAAVLLTPPYNTGSYLNALRLTEGDVDVLDSDQGYLPPTSEADVTQKLADCWTDINTTALAAATEQQNRAASASLEGQQPPKRLCTGGASSRATSRNMFSSFGRAAIVGGAEESKEYGSKEDELLRKAVQGEIMRYQALYMDTNEVDCKTVLSWWGRVGKIKFPYLAPVAQQVFGNQAVAAQVERDFSACGNLLVPNRSRIDTYWVEMVMFLKANYEHIPAYGDIPVISSNDIRACIPARFNGRDTDLVAAEAAFDVLENTEAPPADGMTMD